jgi:hypothetical protein
MLSFRAIALPLVAFLTVACSHNDAPQQEAAAGYQSPPARESDRKVSGLPAGALHAQRVAVMDMNGFEQPLPALFALVPVGWRMQGGVTWGQQFMCTNGYNFNWVAQSPDGLQTVAILPQYKWEANNYGAAPSSPGCQSASINSIQQYLNAVVNQMRPGARIVDFRPRPDLAVQFSNLQHVTPTAMGDMRTWIEAGEVLVEYQENGRAMRGVVAATAALSLMRTRGVSAGQVMEAFTGFAFPGFIASGPAEQFSPQLAETIRQSFLANPAWQANISRHNGAIARVAAQEVAKQAKAIAEYNDYVSLLRQQVSATRAASDERRQRQIGEVIRGTQHFDDASAPGGRAELSNLYDHAWRLNDGSYVLSNDSSFEPYRDLGIEGQKLEQTR